MKTEISIKSFRDEGTADHTYQVSENTLVEAHKCDLCEDIVSPNEILVSSANEEFCLKCYKSGRVEEHYLDITEKHPQDFPGAYLPIVLQAYHIWK